MSSFKADPVFVQRLPEDVVDVGSFYGPRAKMNIEVIAFLEPDVVIAPSRFYYLESELEAKLPSHIKVIRLSFLEVKELAREIRILGAVVNKTEGAKKLAKRVEALKLVRLITREKAS
jgi:ABC-type Fe3+-hydroxamate transport system substrate-binding protein